VNAKIGTAVKISKLKVTLKDVIFKKGIYGEISSEVEIPTASIYACHLFPIN